MKRTPREVKPLQFQDHDADEMEKDLATPAAMRIAFLSIYPNAKI